MDREQQMAGRFHERPGQWARLVGACGALLLALVGVLLVGPGDQGTLHSLARLAAITPALVYALWWMDGAIVGRIAALRASAPPRPALEDLFDAVPQRATDAGAFRIRRDGPGAPREFPGRLRHSGGSVPSAMRPTFRAHTA